MQTIHKRCNWAFMALALVVVGYLVFVLHRYLTFGTYLDHAESDAAVLAWRLMTGQSLYAGTDSAEQFFSLYGPMLCIFSGLPFLLFEPSVALSKLGNSAACISSVGLFAIYTWRRYGADYFGIGVLIFACYPLIATAAGLWIRPEPYTYFLVTAALAATLLSERRDTMWTAVAIAICAGLAMNLKIHSFVYFVPLVMKYGVSRWRIEWPVMFVVAIAVFVLPFALPNVSFTNYVQGVAEFASGRELHWNALRSAIKFSFMFTAPGLFLLTLIAARRAPLSRPDKIYSAVFFLCVVLNLYPSSLPGSTWYHLVPFFPIAVDLNLRYLRALEVRPRLWLTGHAAVALTLIILCVTPQKRLMKIMYKASAWSHEITAEITKAMQSFPGQSIQLGYDFDTAVHYRWTFVRPVIAFAGHPLTVSGVLGMERQFARKDTSSAKIKWIKACRTDVWLIPIGHGRSFSMTSHYGDGQSAFGKQFQTAFYETYEKTEITKHFSVWRCRNR